MGGNEMNGGMDHIFRLRNGKSRSINWENRRGEKGKGGMASSDLGPSRKGSPCIPTVHAGETVTLAEIEGPGILQHIWITVTDRVSDRNRFVLRDLVLRSSGSKSNSSLGRGRLSALRIRLTKMSPAAGTAQNENWSRFIVPVRAKWAMRQREAAA